MVFAGALHNFPCGMATRPCPLEVVTAQPSGDVDDFADEKKARDFAGFHGFGGKLGSVDSSECDFGFRVAFGSGWNERPRSQHFYDRIELRLLVMDERFLRCVLLAPSFGKSLGPELAENIEQGPSTRTGSHEGIHLRRLGQKIKMDGITLPPIARDLQDRGSAQSAMGEQNCLCKTSGVAVGHDGQRNSTEAGHGSLSLRKGERNQCGTKRSHAKAKLPGDAMSKIGRTKLRKGKSTGGDDQAITSELAGCTLQPKQAAVGH